MADYYLITSPPERLPGEGAAVGAIITSPPERVRPLLVFGLVC
ncbi:MAG TPA: hypothetical protein VEU97_10290 [Ktedonobacteraceae bacterium]|nr:hypothetical protein [Ktedonobacteraceae bacterium]